MIVVYTPLYFGPENAFCGREYKAMVMLEEKRLRLLPAHVVRDHGLIIPIVLRGEKRLPSIIKSHQHYRFDDIELADPELKIGQKYSAEIKKIAEYIVDRCDELDGLKDDPCSECDRFVLPSESETEAYLQTIRGLPVTLTQLNAPATNAPADPFPGRANT